MSAPVPADHDNAYAGLLVDDAHWAFGTGPEYERAEDPLTAAACEPVPDGIQPRALAEYCLMLGDDALVLAQRLAHWCGRAPDLEVDIALANIALDLLGQARLLLARAAAADPSLVPALPVGSPVPDEDRLAYFRDAEAFRNLRLVEAPTGDFAETIARLLLFSCLRLAVFEALATSRDPVLAAVAAKGVNEVAYHRDFAARWFVTLALGTAESRRRLRAGLAAVLPLWPEVFATHPVEATIAAAGVGVDPATLRAAVEGVVGRVLTSADLPQPETRTVAGRRSGRDGEHTEALSLLLAELQVVARAHPLGRW